MANVLIDIPDSLLAEIDKEVARLEFERHERRRLASAPPPTEQERLAMEQELATIASEQGIVAAKKRAAEISEEIKAKKEKELDVGKRVSRTSFVQALVLDKFAEMKAAKAKE